jgi:hypothetical protein
MDAVSNESPGRHKPPWNNVESSTLSGGTPVIASSNNPTGDIMLYLTNTETGVTATVAPYNEGRAAVCQNSLMPTNYEPMTDAEAEHYFWTIERTEPTPTGLWHRFLRLIGIED